MVTGGGIAPTASFIICKLFILRYSRNAKNAQNPVLGYVVATRRGVNFKDDTGSLESKKVLIYKGALS
jgi:hypothetical protein